MPSYEEQLHAAQAARDFGAACRVVRALFTATQTQLIRQATRHRCFYNPDFWPECAARAERAHAIHTQVLDAYRQKALLRVAEKLRAEGLDDYAQALESGDYVALGF